MAALGLSTPEALDRLSRFGPNVVPATARPGLPGRVVNQLRDPLIIVLLVAAMLTLVTGDLSDALVILLVILVNTSVGVVQEVRADDAVAALASLAAPHARVVRDGLEADIAAADVVPGDLLVLSEGDLVAADGDLVKADALLVDESSLTGESVPVDKSADADPELRRVSAGTVVVRGRGLAVASATGSNSATGRLATMLAAGPQTTPLQRRLRGLGRILAAVAVVLCALVGVLGWLRGLDLELVALTAVSLVVAAVPESLPAVVTLSLALGARRMAARNAIVRRLPAVETLGSVSVIATDKTGTLTEGRMVVRALWTPAGEAEVTGSDYSPAGVVVRHGTPASLADSPDLDALLMAATLCSDALVRPPDADHPEWHVLGDPTEGALLVAASKLGRDAGAVRASRPRLAEFPFDSVRKRMTTVHRLENGYLVVCKGAPEMLLGSSIGSEPEDLLDAAMARADSYAADGLRVLAVLAAERFTAPATISEAERDLRLLGLVGLADPLKSSARDTIAAMKKAGITPVLITGDHPATARSIAIQAGISSSADEVVDGRDALAMTPGVLRTASVIARATPEQKVTIVEARRGEGAIVAMTGDGVNDAPALQRADIGVAMGNRGTEVARQAADLVLADDELATLVTAVEEGRRIYSNIRRFLLYALSGGAAEILVMIAGPFLGLPLPLLPAQILWINLVTHGLAGVALGAEPSEHGVMGRPPRPPAQSVLGGGLWARILRIAILLTVVTVAIGVWASHSGREWQTMTFVTLGLSQLSVAVALRARPRTWANPFLIVAVMSAAVLLAAAVYLPPLAALLGTTPLPIEDFGLAVGVSVVGFLGVHLDRRLHGRS